MREKVRISDLNLFSMCLSNNWGALEKRCLIDAVNFRNTGGQLTVGVLEGSILDRELAREDISRRYYSNTKNNLRQQIKLYLHLRKEILEQQPSLVHNYSLISLMPLAASLNRYSEIPLIHTFNENKINYRKNILTKVLISRVDSFLTFSPLINEILKNSISVSKRKIEMTAIGLDFPNDIHTKEASKPFIFGIYLSRSINLNHFVNFLMGAMVSFKFKNNILSNEVVFRFMSDVSWFEHPLYQDLKGEVLARGLEHEIYFDQVPFGHKSLKNVHVVLTVSEEELYSQLLPLTLGGMRPLIMPRTAVNKEILKGLKVGETFHPLDSRELSKKMSMLFNNYSEYLGDLNAVAKELRQKHNLDFALEQLFDLYERIYSKRQRLSNKLGKTT